METRLEAMEQQVYKCKGMVERGLNANHMMITEFTNNHKMDAIDIGKHLSWLYDRVDQLQGLIYDLQNQNLGHRASVTVGHRAGVTVGHHDDVIVGHRAGVTVGHRAGVTVGHRASDKSWYPSRGYSLEDLGKIT
ncbi:40s ribosomal protein s5-1 [Hordeum vulgare]|nr:40s ribosomal protein s5-1 [Hordeum vulgare]